MLGKCFLSLSYLEQDFRSKSVETGNFISVNCRQSVSINVCAQNLPKIPTPSAENLFQFSRRAANPVPRLLFVVRRKLFPSPQRNKVIKLKENAFGNAEWAFAKVKVRRIENPLYHSNIIIGFYSIKVRSVEDVLVIQISTFYRTFSKETFWKQTTEFSLINISPPLFHPLPFHFILIAESSFREKAITNPRDAMARF